MTINSQVFLLSFIHDIWAPTDIEEWRLLKHKWRNSVSVNEGKHSKYVE